MLQMNSTEPDIRRAHYEAFNLIKEFVITRPEEIQVADIAMALGIYVREETLIGAEARLLRNKRKGIIRISSAIQQPGRKRFAIAHELGHWKLHNEVLQICTEEDLRGPGSKTIEEEANAFAGALLMPSRMFSPYCTDSQPDLSVILKLTEIFNTTVTATALRFIDESRYPCVIVFSKNRKIVWWKAKRTDGFWIDSGVEVSPHSSAWEPQKGESRHRVNARFWFSEVERYRDVVLYEQSMILGQYGVLTLLSIEDRLEPDDEFEWSRVKGSFRMHK